jgi:hypothetical protein
MTRGTLIGSLLASFVVTAFGLTLALNGQSDSSAKPTFVLSQPDLSRPAFVAYGDIRFTRWRFAAGASSPWARQALVQKIASVNPETLFISGDIPFHGAAFADYEVFKSETKPWAEAHLRVFPVLGNHEFYWRDYVPRQQRALENWWRVFPHLKGRRWYSVQIGSEIYVLCLDSNFGALRAGGPQRVWLEQQIAALPESIKYVFCMLHHDRSGDYVEGNAALAQLDAEGELDGYLHREQQRLRARIVVVSGHIHNYGRFERNGVVYVVSGGGGAHPVSFRRRSDDRFKGKDLMLSGRALPNYNFLRFNNVPEGLKATMERISNPQAGSGAASWDYPDEFTITPR